MVFWNIWDFIINFYYILDLFNYTCRVCLYVHLFVHHRYVVVVAVPADVSCRVFLLSSCVCVAGMFGCVTENFQLISIVLQVFWSLQQLTGRRADCLLAAGPLICRTTVFAIVVVWPKNVVCFDTMMSSWCVCTCVRMFMCIFVGRNRFFRSFSQLKN